MVAAWDGILPEWFTRLSPRFGTPVRSVAVIVGLSVVACALATYGSNAQEAYQLITVEAAFLYDIYFGMMFLIPLTAGSRFGKPASPGLKVSAASGLLVTVLHAGFSLYPIIDDPNPWLFARKIVLTAVVINAAGLVLYWQARRVVRSETALSV
jgi:amino acid transporter